MNIRVRNYARALKQDKYRGGPYGNIKRYYETAKMLLLGELPF